MDIKTIYLDMDEVLTDFVGGLCKLYGFSEKFFYYTHPKSKWDVTPTIGITPDAMYSRINETVGFWRELEPTPWFRDLVALVESYDIPWYVVSDPGPYASAYNEKIQWLRSMFGEEFRNFILTPHKFLLNRPDVVLIDDKTETCHLFSNYVLFPCHLNINNHFSDDPVNHVRNRMKEILDAPEVS